MQGFFISAQKGKCSSQYGAIWWRPTKTLNFALTGRALFEYMLGAPTISTYFGILAFGFRGHQLVNRPVKKMTRTVSNLRK